MKKISFIFFLVADLCFAFELSCKNSTIPPYTTNSDNPPTSKYWINNRPHEPYTIVIHLDDIERASNNESKVDLVAECDQEEPCKPEPKKNKSEKYKSRGFSPMTFRRRASSDDAKKQQQQESDECAKEEEKEPCVPERSPCDDYPEGCESPQDEKDCNSYTLPKLIQVRHIGTLNSLGKSPSLASNYSSLTMILSPEYQQGKFLPLIDLRAHRADNTCYMLNIGYVGRLLPEKTSPMQSILGFNLFYDYRQASIGYFNQLGFGLESLNDRWEFRGNVYVPFGSRSHHKKCYYDGYIGDYYYMEDLYEYISYSFNAEVGYYAAKCKDYFLYLAAGPYYIAGRYCVDNTMGGELRLRPQYKDIFALDLSYRYDSLFRSVWQLEVVIQLPLYKIKHRCQRPCGLSDWQIYQPIQRFEVMPVGMRRCWKYNF